MQFAVKFTSERMFHSAGISVDLNHGGTPCAVNRHPDHAATVQLFHETEKMYSSTGRMTMPGSIREAVGLFDRLIVANDRRDQ